MTKVTEKEEPGAASKKPSLTACLCTRTFIKKHVFLFCKTPFPLINHHINQSIIMILEPSLPSSLST